MIDMEYKVRRYITEFSEETEELIAEHELSDFDLKKFRHEFGEDNPDQGMITCYQITESNINFLEKYLASPIDWDFKRSSYFVEVHSI